MHDDKGLHVFLNYACQAKCAFCYNPPLTPELNAWVLPLEALAKQLLDHGKQGYRSVTFSGGEVTLLKELDKMLRLSRRAGFSRIGIISNGLRLAERAYLERLREAGLDFCCLSIHGAQAKRHDEILAVPGAFDKAVRALDHLTEMGLPVVLNFVIIPHNIAETEAFIDRFAGYAAVQEFQIYFPHYEGLMAVNARELKVSMAEAVPVLRRTLAKARALKIENKVHFYNLPPCAAPDLGPWLRNWNRDDETLLLDPQGAADGTASQSLEQKPRRKVAACKSCVIDARCLGFESRYLETFGVEGVRAIKDPSLVP
jgi:MoaA/NifB/PqqE/SkfB family radical SAM enzyme